MAYEFLVQLSRLWYKLYCAIWALFPHFEISYRIQRSDFQPQFKNHATDMASLVQSLYSNNLPHIPVGPTIHVINVWLRTKSKR